MFIDRDCVVCGGPGRPLNRSYVHACLAQCRKCKMIYAPEIPGTQALSAHYALYDRNVEVSQLTIDVYSTWVTNWRDRGAVSHLDFGCGSGALVSYANSRGLQSIGCELDRDIVSKLQSKNINVLETEEVLRSNITFDVITIIEVIEHVSNPKEILGVLAKKLNPGGIIVITTPNFNSLNRRILRGSWPVFSFPEHLNLFQKTTMKRLLLSCGFTIELIRTNGFAINIKNSNTPNTNSLQKILTIDNQRRFFLRNRFTRSLKRILNSILNKISMGDTLIVQIRLCD